MDISRRQVVASRARLAICGSPRVTPPSAKHALRLTFISTSFIYLVFLFGRLLVQSLCSEVSRMGWRIFSSIVVESFTGNLVLVVV